MNSAPSTPITKQRGPKTVRTHFYKTGQKPKKGGFTANITLGLFRETSVIIPGRENEKIRQITDEGYAPITARFQECEDGGMRPRVEVKFPKANVPWEDVTHYGFSLHGVSVGIYEFTAPITVEKGTQLHIEDLSLNASVMKAVSEIIKGAPND